VSSNFEHLAHPKETASGKIPESWYVETLIQDGNDRVLLNHDNIISYVNDVRSPLEEIYYDNESEAYAAIMDYYDENHVYFPYHDEWMEALKKDGIIDTVKDTVESAVMEF
jgi:hypothetical protein